MKGLRLALLLATAACSEPSDEPVSQEPESTPEHRVEAENPRVGEGELIIIEQRTWLPEGWTHETDPLDAPGLEIQALAPIDPVDDGGRDLHVSRHALSGPPGSYIVHPGETRMQAALGESETHQPPSIFVDIGVEAPGETTLTDFHGVPEPVSTPADERLPWLWITLAGLVAILLGVLAWKRRLAPGTPLSPLEQALQDWQHAQAAALDDQALAAQLSWIFRGYLEAMHRWPARSRTSREVLAWLRSEALPSLSDDLLGSADRILSATDRLKFGREGGGESFFQSLEVDLIHILETTSAATQATEEVIHD